MGTIIWLPNLPWSLGEGPCPSPPLVLGSLPPLVILAIGPTRTILQLDPALSEAGGLSKPLYVDCIHLKKSRAANLTRKPRHKFDYMPTFTGWAQSFGCQICHGHWGEGPWPCPSSCQGKSSTASEAAGSSAQPPNQPREWHLPRK